jgi:hypothetical protein
MDGYRFTIPRRLTRAAFARLIGYQPHQPSFASQPSGLSGVEVTAALVLCGHADLAEAVQDLVIAAIQVVHGITPVSHQSHVTAGAIPAIVAVPLANMNRMGSTVGLFRNEEYLIMHDEPHARDLGYVKTDRNPAPRETGSYLRGGAVQRLRTFFTIFIFNQPGSLDFSRAKIISARKM